MWSEADRRAVALGGSSIDDRLALAAADPAGAGDSALADRNWADWLESATIGDQAAFARALAGEGIDPGVARRAMGLTTFPAARPLPRWVADVTGLIEAATRPGPAAPRPGDPPLPFDPLFRLMADAALQAVERRLGGDPAGVWQPEARAMLGRRLAQDLGELCGPAMLAAFAAGRGAPPGAPDAPPPSEAFQAYVARLRAGALWAFFRERPVLARLAGERAAGAVDAAVELLARLHDDRPAIEQRFFAGAAPGPLAALEVGLSDRHDGRTVAILGFPGGRKLVYKPRDCRVDHAWVDLLGWLGDRVPGLDVRAPAVLTRPGYGWIEFVQAAPCADREAAGRYYRRVGAVLALAYLLRSRDLHQENLVAAGEHPVVIDLETILSPEMAVPGEADSGPGRATREARRRLDRSVGPTLLLPTAMPAAADRYFAIGALSPAAAQPIESYEWEHLNTDGMRRVRRTRLREGNPALAQLDGAPAPPAEYLPQLVAGFEAAARAVLAHREALLAPGGPLAAFGPVSLRIVLRATQFYGLLLERARAIRNLGDGVAWSRHFYFLWRQAPPYPAHWRILRRERACLSRQDVPRFVVGADESRLDLGNGERVDGLFESAALPAAREGLLALDERAIAAQVARIRAAFGADAAPVPRPAAPATAAERRRRAVAAAAELIATEAIEAEGGAAWITRSPVVSHAPASECGVTGPDLYNGASGIAVFLGAMHATVGGGRWRDLASAAVAPVCREARDGPADLVERIGIGGAAGVGSVIYALTRLAGFLGRDDYLEDARRLAAAVDAGALARDRHYDVIGGAAGLILALVPLARATGDAALPRLAEAAGDHLLDHRTAASTGHRVWAAGRMPALTGLSHGAAGMALALARLAGLTGAERFLDAAGEAIGFERACYSAEHGGWPDLRPRPDGGPMGYPCQWCHGAAGIGLARLASRAALKDPAVDDEIRAAVRTTLAWATPGPDHYCCGTLGRIETLFAVARAEGDARLAAAAEARLDAVIAAAEQRGAYRWIQGPDAENLGLFQGLAGLGYQILRLDYPERVPSVLAWD
jgi:type 2 lantibiotic biosynthesis protein LanM